VIALLLAGTVVAVLALLLGLRDLLGATEERRRIVSSIVDDPGAGGSDDLVRRDPRLARLDRALRGTRAGRRLERELTLAGVRRSPSLVLAAGVTVAAVTAVALWSLLAPAFGVLGLLAGVLAVRGYLRRERTRRLEAFVGQLPELARVLANATNAGLSIHTAVGVAAEELDDPSRAELRRVANRIAFGAPLEAALLELDERLPSREIAVLTSTLVVSARSGGSLVDALRGIADTLETRKETRREIRTTLAQSLATGYLVIVLGFGLLLLLNLMAPGTVQKMTTSPVGQVALVTAGSLFAGGFLVIRRMTRIDP
jgi:tight adherence protein B